MCRYKSHCKIDLTKAQLTHNIYGHNTVTKRLRHFSFNIFFLCELKIFIFRQLCLLKPSLKIFLNVTTIFWRKKYLNIKMSFYLFISKLCAMCDVGLKFKVSDKKNRTRYLKPQLCALIKKPEQNLTSGATFERLAARRRTETASL